MDGNSTWKSGLTALLAFAFFAGALFADAPTVGTVYVSGYNATGQVVFASFELAGGDPNVTSCHYNPRIGIAGWHLMNEYNNVHLLCYDANADLHEAPSLDTIRVQATNANGTGESPSNVTLDNSPPSTCDVSAIDELSAYAYVDGTTIYYNNASAGDFNVTVDAVDDDSGIYYVSFPGTVSNGDYAYSVPYLLTYDWTTSSTATYNPAIATCYDNMRVNSDNTTFSVILDNTAPVIGTVAIVPSYFNGSMRYVSILSNISATASDSGSGLNESSCEYYTDGSTWTAASYAGGECYANGVDTSAASEINMRVWDNVNNSDTDNGTPVLVDANTPVTTPDAVNEDGSTYTESTWTASPYVNVTLTCADSQENDSGCNITYYCTDTIDTCTPDTEYTDPVQITTEGTSYIRFLSVDQVGNNESAGSFTVLIDTTAPTTTATGVIDDGSAYTFGVWSNSTYVNVTLTCDDGTDSSGCDTTLYCLYNITDAPCTPDTVYTAPVMVDTENGTNITFSSNDTVNNVETAHSEEVDLDWTGPIFSNFVVDPLYDNGTANYTAEQASIRIDAFDYQSGVDGSTCEYTIDGGSTWTAGTWTGGYRCYADFIDTTTASVIGFRMSDNLGNPSTSDTIAVLVDLNDPNTTADGNGYTFSTWTNSPPVLVNLTCTDSQENDSGCNITYYCIDTEGACSPYSMEIYNGTSIVVSDENVTYVNFMSLDNVLHHESDQSVQIWIDTVEPTVTIQSPVSALYNTNTTDLNYTAEDATSGVDSCWYEVDGGANSTPSATCDNATVADLGEGNHTIIVYANDSAGNIGSASIGFYVDTIAPTVGAITVVPLYNDGSINWISGLSTISAPVSDGGSGINTTSCFYTRNASSIHWYGNPSAYNGSHCVFTDVNTSASVFAGVESINIQVDDLAGNTGSGTPVNVTPDETAPTTTATGVDSVGNPYTFGTWTNESVTVTLNCTDTESECNITYYCVDDSDGCVPNNTYSGAFLASPGVTTTWYARFNSIDNVGNEEAVQSEAMMFDLTVPHVSIQSPTSMLYTTNYTDLNYSSTDADSGVDSCWYEVDGGANSTPSATCDNATLTDLAEGNHTVIVYSNDSVGNIGSATVSFFVDTVRPTVGTVTVTPLYNDGSINWISGLSTISAPVSDGGSGINTTTCLYTTNTSYGWYMIPSAYNGSHCVFTDVNTSASITGGVKDINVAVYDIAQNLGLGTPVNVTPDETAPTTTATAVDVMGNPYAFATWTNDTVTVTLNCTDGRSGCNRTMYGLYYGTSCSAIDRNYTAPVAVGGEGVIAICYYSVDQLENTEANSTQQIWKDMSAPSIAISSPTSTVYGTAAIPLNYAVSDSLSGVNRCWYKVDGGVSIVLANCTNGSLSGLAQGNHTVTVYVNDSVNNINSSSVSFTVDTTAPTTTASAGTYTFGTWTNRSVSVNLTCADTGGASCDKTLYCTDTTNTCTPTSTYGASSVDAVSISTEGTSYIRYRSNDTVSNMETTKSSTIMIDTTAPSTAASAVMGNGSAYTFGGDWAFWNATVTLNCTDASSGCNRTLYCVDTTNNCTPSTAYTTPVLIDDEGTNYIRYYSTDNVSNTETTKNQTVNVYLAPVLAFTANPELYTPNKANYFEISYLAMNRSTARLTVDGRNYTMTCNDTHCWVTVTVRKGLHTYQAWMTDTSSRTGNTSTFNFTVDYTPPRAYYTSLSVRNGGTVAATGFFQARYYEINLKNATVYLNDTTANTTSSYGMTCETGGLRICNLTLTSTDDDGFGITSGGELIVGHTYRYYITVFDLADNYRTLKVRRFTVVGSP